MPPQTTSNWLHISRPEVGQQTVLRADAKASGLRLNFPANAAALAREDDDLVFSFEDGARVVLQDFYTSYTSENVPDFNIEGTLVAGSEFFAALDEELMPAAGNTATVNSGGRFHEYDDLSLIDGIDALGPLDPYQYPVASVDNAEFNSTGPV